MDSESLRYFLETARSLNITETAERLFISQQTLSNHIHRVEKYYGAPLFNRLPRLQLTSAGEEVLKYAETVFHEEKKLLTHIADLAHIDHGQVSIGVTSPRCTSYLPEVLNRYSKLYPNVKISCIEALNSELEKRVQQNKIDFALCGNVDTSISSIRVFSSHEDPIYFCVPDRLLYRYYHPDEVEHIKKISLNGADMNNFSRIPFMIPTHLNRLGQRVSQCFAEANIVPNIYFSSNHTTMLAPLCNQGLCGGFTSHMNLSNWKAQMTDEINIFPLSRNGKPVTLDLKLISHKQRYLNHFAIDLIHLTDEILSNIVRQDLSRISTISPDTFLDVDSAV